MPDARFHGFLRLPGSYSLESCPVSGCIFEFKLIIEHFVFRIRQKLSDRLFHICFINNTAGNGWSNLRILEAFTFLLHSPAVLFRFSVLCHRDQYIKQITAAPGDHIFIFCLILYNRSNGPDQTITFFISEFVIDIFPVIDIGTYNCYRYNLRTFKHCDPAVKIGAV